MTVAPLALVRQAAATLEAAGCDSPQLDAELLVAHALGTDRAGLVRMEATPLPEPVQELATELVRRRAAREPVSQIVGSRWFRNIEIRVTPAVLTPRPETEHLVEWALGLPDGARVADVGTGSGAIALALADERPDLDLIASDVDADALAVAADNAGRLGLAVSFVQSDLLADIDGNLDAVVSNPPYIPDGDFPGLDPEVRDHEPRIALTSGADGLDTVRRLIAEAAGRGIPRIALEIGEGQAEATSALLTAAGFTSVEVVNDLAGIGRVVAGTKVGG